MKLVTTREYTLSSREFFTVRQQYHSSGIDIQESVIEWLSDHHSVRIDHWLYRYHEDVEGGGFRIILSDEGSDLDD